MATTRSSAVRATIRCAAGRGGAGINIAEFPGHLSDYTISLGPVGTTNVSHFGETDTLTAIQALRFGSGVTLAADGPWWYDIMVGSAVTEGSGAARQMTFTVERRGDTSLPSSVAWTTCTCGLPYYAQPVDAADFVGGEMPSGLLGFAAGQTSQVITIDIADDSLFESDESFRMKLLETPNGAELAHASVVSPTIHNDDGVLRIFAESADLPEGNGGTTAFTFTVRRDIQDGNTYISEPRTVEWSVAGLADTGTLPADDADFAGAALPSGTVSFVFFETIQTITVNIAGDAYGEANESFQVTLSNPSAGFSIATATADTVILNDDATLSITALSANKPEGTGTTTPFTFTVTRTDDTTGATTADWAVTGRGTRPADAQDFTGAVLPTDTVSFSAGETSQTITIDVVGDAITEPGEGFSVALGTATAAGTIQADDAIADLIVVNSATGLPVAAAPVFYSGPVAGLDKELILVTPDNINISAAGPNWFIHTGSGDDAIAAFCGTNVLDGGTASNFLTGAAGADTFFVDARGATAPIWSTVVGFGPGDAATIWGISQAGFTLDWVDGKGAQGFTGLTMHATAAAGPAASLTLARFSRVDMDQGRISVIFGNDPGSGSDYMYIHVV